MSDVQAGWYPNPDGTDTYLYWDGDSWMSGAKTRDEVLDNPSPPVQEVPVEIDVDETEAGEWDTPAGWYPNPDGSETFLYWTGEVWAGQAMSESELRAQKQVSDEPVQQKQVHVEVPKVGLLGGKKVAIALAAELESTNQQLADALARVSELDTLVKKYGLESDQERELERLKLAKQIEHEHSQIEVLGKTRTRLKEEIDRLNLVIVDLRSVASLQSFGLYDFEHPAESSVDLSEKLANVRAGIKKAVASKTATTAVGGFTFNNSLKEGEKFVKDMSALLLRAYNAEAENCVKGAKAGNYEANVKRLNTAITQIERQGSMIKLRISQSYHKLRLQEIEIATKYLQVLAEEKAADQERRAQLREDAKAAREMEREMKKLNDNRQMLESTLAAAQANGDQEAIEQTLAKISAVEKDLEDVNARAANRRMGHVYVISNIGAFGPDVVKIGMTRRMDPLDRVRELGDASVPFRFDTHAMIFSEDAVALETALHQRFESKRVNKINAHREFFRVTPAEVLDELKNEKVVVVSYVVDPAAEEYRASVGLIDPSSVSEENDPLLEEGLSEGEEND